MKHVTLIPEIDTVVWGYREADLWPYHVYGLCRTHENALLALSEGRLLPSDTDPHHLVLKRSETCGDDWSEAAILEESRDGESWSNMSLVTDFVRQRVWVFYALNDDNRSTRVFCRYSDDGGNSWSQRYEMTGLVAGKDDNGWTFFFPGPAHGIQLCRQRDEIRNGRLVVSFWNRRAIDADPRWYGASAIYLDTPDSADPYLGWQFGGFTEAALADGSLHGMNEASVTELEDGRLLFHGRGANGTATAKKRVYAYSDDGAQTIGNVTVRNDFEFSGCQAATIGHDGVLYFSHPNAPDRRANLTVSFSYDNGATWSQHQQISDDGAMYSDMAILPENRLCVLHGSGVSRHGGLPREVRVKRFRISAEEY